MTLLEEEKKRLVEGLWKKGIKNDEILKAIYNVPREKFVSPALRKHAYDDNALPIECAQTISQPYTVAYMTQILDVKKGNKILEIGTGSGYQAAILYQLGADVYSIERIEKLYQKVKVLFEELHINIHLKLDDGTFGWEDFAPFHKIIVTAGAQNVPNKLLEQLDINGKMVIPVGSHDTQRLLMVHKTKTGVEKKYYDYFKFVPLIGEGGWES